MANSKRVKNYTGTSIKPSVPTSVNNALIREIADNTFTSDIETVQVDTYANDILGAPWGAQNVLWLKGPKCKLTYNGNGGSIPVGPSPEPTVITWDGDITGRTPAFTYTGQSGLYQYYKLSDNIVPYSTNLSHIAVNKLLEPINSTSAYEPISGSGYVVASTISWMEAKLVIITAANTIFSIFDTELTFPEVGTYAFYFNGEAQIITKEIKDSNSQTIFSWDGDITGKTAVLIHDSFGFYKINSDTPVSSIFENSTVMSGGQANSSDLYNKIVNLGDYYIGAYVEDRQSPETSYEEPYIVVTTKPNVTIKLSPYDETGIVVAEAGVYFVYLHEAEPGIMDCTMYNQSFTTGQGPSPSPITEKEYDINKGMATKLLHNMFTNVPSGKTFDGWLIGSTSGAKMQPGAYYAFSESTSIYASWLGQRWKDNSCTSTQASVEGWLWDGSNITGWNSAVSVVASSTYNIPKTIDGVTMTTVSGFGDDGNSVNAFPAISAIGGRGVLEISDSAFMANASLIEVSFPQCSTIGIAAFGECTCLSSTYIPNCSYIGGMAFYECTNLNNISFPQCSAIGPFAFLNCANLKSAVFSNCTVLESQNDPDYPITATFANCTALSYVDFPKLSYVPAYAFMMEAYHQAPATVSLATCSGIGDYGFAGMNIDAIYLLSTSVVSLGEDALTFDIVGGCSNIYVPSSMVSLYKNDPQWVSYSTIIKPAAEVKACLSLSITGEDCCADETTTQIHAIALCEMQYIGESTTYTETRTFDEISNPFTENTSVDAVQKTISYTYLGITAQCTITQAGASKWKANNKATTLEAEEEGWDTSNYIIGTICGFNEEVNPLSTYNIPKKIGNNYMVTISGLSTLPFTAIGGQGIIDINDETFADCTALAEISFPNCSYIGSYAFANTAFQNAQLSNSGIAKLTTNCQQFILQASNTLSGSIIDTSTTFICGVAFEECSNLILVSFPNCVDIEDYAFNNCSGLTYAAFPICSAIYGHTFNNCTNLVDVIFPNCSYIGYAAFSGCTSLVSASFSNCRKIEDSAFCNCTALVELSFPNCSYIGSEAFQSCNSLTTISFPNCSYIERYAFSACSNLTTVSFPNCSYIKGDVFDGTAWLSNQLSNSNIAKLTTNYQQFIVKVSSGITGKLIDNSATFICEGVFYSCNNLTEVSFYNCNYIGDYAFNNCTELTTVYFMGTSVPVAEGENIFNYNTLEYIVVQESLVDAFKSAENWSYYSDKIIGWSGKMWEDNDKSTWAEANTEGWLGTNNYVSGWDNNITINPVNFYNIPRSISNTTITNISASAFKQNDFNKIGGKGIIVIDNSAFYSCSKLTTISFPNCSYIGTNAFENCYRLATASFPNCSYIESYAFAQCSKLISVLCPNCAYINDDAFNYCGNLVDIALSNCNYIGRGAFRGCGSLTTVSFPNCSYIGNGAFFSCDTLTTVSFPNCSYIGYDAFYSCVNLSSISASDCKYIGGNAFAKTSWLNTQFSNSAIAKLTTNYEQFIVAASLEQISGFITDESATFICDNAFESTSLTGLSCYNCNYIGCSAFQRCSSLITVSIPNCSYIGSFAFRSCNNLTIVSSPNCNYIRYDAFYNCASLTTASFPNCSYIESYAFAYCKLLATASFPECNYIGSWAFCNCSKLTEASFLNCSFIGMSAFYSCSSLTEISFPNCSYIDAAAFKKCSLLTTAYFMSTSIPTLNTIDVFSECTSLTSIYVRNSLAESFKTARVWSYYSSKIVGI